MQIGWRWCAKSHCRQHMQVPPSVLRPSLPPSIISSNISRVACALSSDTFASSDTIKLSLFPANQMIRFARLSPIFPWRWKIPKTTVVWRKIRCDCCYRPQPTQFWRTITKYHHTRKSRTMFYCMWFFNYPKMNGKPWQSTRMRRRLRPKISRPPERLNSQNHHTCQQSMPV